MTTAPNPIDFALRVVESIAFSIHSILGLTEPCTGILRKAFGDNGALPSWFWPIAGAMLLLVAISNFSGNNTIVLAAQAYIAAFHIGGFFYHVRIGHSPVVGMAPAVLSFLAFGVVWIRTSLWVAFVGWIGCAIVAAILSVVLVTPPKAENSPLIPTSVVS